MQTCIIINPTSGQGKALSYVDEIRKRLLACGLPQQLTLTQRAGNATVAAEKAVADGCDLVVACGGDGTINEVINGLKGAPVKLGLIPLGTGNVLARDVNIPIDDVEAACDIITRGKTKTVDLAKADGRYFVLMAGFGFDAAVVDRVVPRVKDMLGAMAYGPAIISALFKHKAAHFTLELDGEEREVDASLIVVANSGSYAYNIKVVPKAEMDDGLLDVCVFAKASPQRIALLRQAWHVLISNHGADPNLLYFKVSRITVKASPDVLVQIDGDVVGTTPRTIEAVPGALKLIVP